MRSDVSADKLDPPYFGSMDHLMETPRYRSIEEMYEYIEDSDIDSWTGRSYRYIEDIVT